MIQHYVKVSKILMWIEKQKNCKDEKDYGEIDEWDNGYDTCLNNLKDVLEDFPLEEDKNDEVQKDDE